MINRSIPIPVSTGSLYPLPTLESIHRLKDLGVRDVELTLQTNEFFIRFERRLSFAIGKGNIAWDSLMPVLKSLPHRIKSRWNSVIPRK